MPDLIMPCQIDRCLLETKTVAIIVYLLLFIYLYFFVIVIIIIVVMVKGRHAYRSFQLKLLIT